MSVRPYSTTYDAFSAKLKCLILKTFDVNDKMVFNMRKMCATSTMLAMLSLRINASEDDSCKSDCEMKLLVESSLALGLRYFAVCAIVLHPYERHAVPYKVWALTRALAQSSTLTINALNFSAYLTYLHQQDQTKCSRTMLLVYGEDQMIRPQLTELSLNIDMTGPFWLLFLDKAIRIEEYLDEADLPFDLDMVVGQVTSPEMVMLHEVYRVSRVAPVLPVRVVLFGSYNYTSRQLVSPPHISLYYGDRRNNLEGVTFKVATASSFPVVVYTRDKDGRVVTSGYFPTVWKELEERLNFTTRFSMPGDESTGILMRNGSWSGVMGMVVRDEAQVGLANIIHTAERSLYVDFLRPLITTRNNLFYKKPGIEVRWDAILRPFEGAVWLTILGWIIVGSVGLWQVVRLTATYAPRDTANDFNLLNSFFSVLRAFSQQGTPAIPSALPGRILIITCYLVSVVLVTAYSGTLISFIAVQIPRVPFRSLMELTRHNTYKVSVVKDTASFMYFANASEDVLSAVYTMMDVENLPMNHALALDRVCADSMVVHFGPQALMDLLVKQKNLYGCDIMWLPQALNIVYITIIMQKNNQYKDAINHHIDMMIYQGTLGRMRKQLWEDLGPLVPQSKVEVRTEQVTPIYMVLLAGFALAAFLFLCEKLRRKPERKISTVSFSNLRLI